MDYYKKYLKYKLKYLQLKKQNGGSCRQLVLLSEACNTTNTIYHPKIPIEHKYYSISNSFLTNLPDYIQKSNEYIENIGFLQDPMIQYYNLGKEKYVNYLNKLGEKKGSMQLKFYYPFAIFPRDLKSIVKKYVNNLNIVYKERLKDLIITKNYNQETIDQITQEGKDTIIDTSGFTKDEIKAKILFLNNYEEYHKLFPNDKFKLPFYNIPHMVGNDEYIRNYKSHSEFEKGGNFISSPPTSFAKYGVVFYINGITTKTYHFINDNLCQSAIGLNCSFPYFDSIDGNNFRHIDELMTFMPYGENQFKIWFYGERGLDETQREERLSNLNKICRILYNSTFDENIDKFVFFDLYLTDENKFSEPPVMNRLFIETETDIYGFFSDTSHNDQVSEEWERVSSFSGIEKVKHIHFINTSRSNLDLGNLHCLIKNTLNYTTLLPLR